MSISVLQDGRGPCGYFSEGLYKKKSVPWFKSNAEQRRCLQQEGPMHTGQRTICPTHLRTNNKFKDLTAPFVFVTIVVMQRKCVVTVHLRKADMNICDTKTLEKSCAFLCRTACRRGVKCILVYMYSSTPDSTQCNSQVGALLHMLRA